MIGDNDIGSSSSESEDQTEWTAEDEKDFLRTLGALKTHDPNIYENDLNFFGQKDSGTKLKTSSMDRPPAQMEKMTLKDFERKLVSERKGKLSEDEEDEDDYQPGTSSSQDFKSLKQAFKNAMDSSDDGSDSEGLLKRRVKTKKEQIKEEEDYCEWLRGGTNLEVHDKNLQKLKKRWCEDKELEEDEKFLRDYLLDKKYEEKNGDSDDRIPTYEEIIREEEDEDKADEFEQKFNFRFEEPDQEFLKQYPRTVREALRQTKAKRQSKRKEKREEKKLKRCKIEQVEIPFRYRSVVPNSFGLSTEEILHTDDRCLNAWAPVSKMSQYCGEEEERQQLVRFERKARNLEKKQKLLNKFKDQPMEEGEANDDRKDGEEEEQALEEDGGLAAVEDPSTSASKSTTQEIVKGKERKKKRKGKLPTNSTDIGKVKKGGLKRGKGSRGDELGQKKKQQQQLDVERLKAYGVSTKKLRRAQFGRRKEQQQLEQ